MRSWAGDQTGRSIRASVSTVESRPVSSPRTRSLRVASAIETHARRNPSGDTAGQRSTARSLVTRDSFPCVSCTQSIAAPARPRTKKMRPSAATAGSASGSDDDVTRRGSPPVTLGPIATLQMAERPPRSDEKTMALPSLVHAGCRSQPAPDVTCVHCPVREMIQRWPRTLTARRPSRAYAGSRAPAPGAPGCIAAVCSTTRNAVVTSIRRQLLVR